MVEYDRYTRLCICVENDPSDYDYASDAWSCDSLCHLVFVADKVRVYSLAEGIPSEYDASVVLDNFEVLFVTRKDSSLRKQQTYTTTLSGYIVKSLIHETSVAIGSFHLLKSCVISFILRRKKCIQKN